MQVRDPPEEAYSTDEEDISEPEEDSLAGQMAMMRGGKVKPSPVHGLGEAGEGDGGEGDSESEYEYEYDSSSDEDERERDKSRSAPSGKAQASKSSDRRKGKAINEDSSSDED